MVTTPPVTPDAAHSPTRVIVDGRMLYAGHKWSWRRGIVIGHTAQGFLQVRLERRGRERHWPEAELAPAWCLSRDLALEAVLRRCRVLDGRDDADAMED
jgi:hypothetical protein